MRLLAISAISAVLVIAKPAVADESAAKTQSTAATLAATSDKTAAGSSRIVAAQPTSLKAETGQIDPRASAVTQLYRASISLEADTEKAQESDVEKTQIPDYFTPYWALVDPYKKVLPIVLKPEANLQTIPSSEQQTGRDNQQSIDIGMYEWLIKRGATRDTAQKIAGELWKTEQPSTSPVAKSEPVTK